MTISPLLTVYERKCQVLSASEVPNCVSTPGRGGAKSNGGGESASLIGGKHDGLNYPGR